MVTAGLTALAAALLSASGFYGVDSGASCLARDPSFRCPRKDGDKFLYVLDQIKSAGFGFARERMHWPSLNPRRGEFANLNVFVRDNCAYAERGIRPSWVFHIAPGWTHPRADLPDDLMGLYDFCSHVAGGIVPLAADWEMWNEVDVDTCPITAWDFMSAVKVAYLGCKRGNSASTVLMGSICKEHRSAFDEVLVANDLAEYTDAFNYHLYLGLPKYEGVLRELRSFLERQGLGDRAIWVTEFGGKGEGRAVRKSAFSKFMAHSPAQELYQAEFAVKGLVLLQMEGVARAYPFVFPPFNEDSGRKDWGFVRRDGTLKPVVEWSREMIGHLGGSKIVGELERPAGDVRAFLYENDAGDQICVYWAETAVDTSNGNVDVDRIGQVERPFLLPTGRGERRTLVARRRPGYALGLKGLRVKRTAVPPGRLGTGVPTCGIDRNLVLQVLVKDEDATVVEGKSALELKGDACGLSVVVWNFDDQEKSVMLKMKGGRLEGSEREQKVPPFGKVSFDGRLAVTEGSGLRIPVEIRAVCDEDVSSRLTLPILCFEKWRRVCTEIEPDWANPVRWCRNDSADRSAMAFDASAKAMRFEYHWTGNVAHWAYPYLELTKDELKDAEYLEFEIRAESDRPGKYGATLVMVDRADGRLDEHIGYELPTESWERRHVRIGGDGQAAVTRLRIGLNPLGSDHVHWIRNLKVLKSPAAGRRGKHGERPGTYEEMKL